MREIRLSGSEGGGDHLGLSLPLSKRCGAENVSAPLFAAAGGRSVPDT